MANTTDTSATDPGDAIGAATIPLVVRGSTSLEMVRFTRGEWDRIRRFTNGVSRPQPWIDTACSVAAGGWLSALLTLLSLYEDRHTAANGWWFTQMVFVACLFAFVGLLASSRSIRQQTRYTVDMLNEELDAVEHTF